MGWIHLTLFALQIAPRVLELVMEIENQIGGGNGSVKKELAMNAIESTIAAGGTANSEFIVKATGNLIDRTVTTLNTAGILKH